MMYWWVGVGASVQCARDAYSTRGLGHYGALDDVLVDSCVCACARVRDAYGTRGWVIMGL